MRKGRALTTIAQAVADLKIDLPDDETVCIVFGQEHYKEYPLHAVADREIGADVYISTGTFHRDQRFGKGGRTLANVQRIWGFPFDFDLKDFLDMEGQDLWELDEKELDFYRARLQEAIENVTAKIGLPIHRLDSTGYGLSAYTYLPDHQPEAVPELKKLHGRIVDRINAVWGGKLADDVKDAGPRIMRLVPCLNAKGETPRQSRTLYFQPARVDQAILETAAGPYTARQTTHVPHTGKALPAEVVDLIIDSVRPNWTPGQKHFMARAVSGYLAKNMVPEDQATAIIERLAADDAKPWSRIQTCRDTYTRYRQGIDIDGYMALRELMDADHLAEIDTVLARHRNANAPKIIIGGKDANAVKKPTTAVTEPAQRIIHFTPPPALGFRGWIGEYVDLMTPTTEAPRAFHLGIGLTMAGAILGRDVWCPYGEPTRANLFTLLVGKSGKTRKDTAIRRGIRMITDSHLTDKGTLANVVTHVITDVGSSEALMDELATHPNLTLYSTEFSKLMGNARRKATSTIIPTLMQAWDAPPIMSSLTRGNPVEAHYPYMTVIAATQPEILANIMSEEDVYSGFANRWFFIPGEPTNTPIPSPPSVDIVLQRELYNQLRSRRDQASRHTHGIPLAADATLRWEQWYVSDYHRDSDTPEEDAMRPRHASLIRKLALIYAATEGSPVITLDHLEASIAVIEWMGKNVGRMIGTWGESSFAKLERRVRDVLMATPGHTMKRRDLQRKCASRSWTSRDFNITLDAMKASDIVFIDAMNNVMLATDGDSDMVGEA